MLPKKGLTSLSYCFKLSLTGVKKQHRCNYKAALLQMDRAI